MPLPTKVQCLKEVFIHVSQPEDEFGILPIKIKTSAKSCDE